uniref:Putative secreted peptide n=1 Tax=Anopheles braziliensis TaxID=58242 RepID=A0A2M3ZRY2_9DIPT
MVKCTLSIVVSSVELVEATDTVPRMFGSLEASILPMSQWSTLLTVSYVYLPWLTTSEQFVTAFGMQMSNLTPSTVRPIVVFGPTVMSNLDCSPDRSTRLCRT